MRMNSIKTELIPCPVQNEIDYFPGLRFSCNFVAARFFIFWSRLSALIRDVLPLVLFPEEELLLLLDELVDLLDVPLTPVDLCGRVCCLLKVAIKPALLLPLTEFGESDRLL